MSGEISREYDSEAFSRDKAGRIPKTICAFANSSGGEIVCESPGRGHIPPLEWHKKPVTFRGRMYKCVEDETGI